MEKNKSVFSNIRISWFSLAVSIIAVAFYLNAVSFSIPGLLGFVLLNFLVFYFIEHMILKDYGITVKRNYSLILAGIGIVFVILSIINSKITDNFIAFIVASVAVVVITCKTFADQVKSKTSRLFVVFGSFGLLFALIYLTFAAGSYSPDSYMYYDISKTTLIDYGNTGMIRQYVIDSIYNCSFPYFYPLCIFIVDRLTGLGLASGILVDLYAMCLSIILVMRLSKKVTGTPYGGIIASFVLITSPYYLDEVGSGRAIPVSLVFILIMLGIFYSMFTADKTPVSRILVLGASAGLAVVTRFDNLPLAAFCFLVLIFVSKKKIRDMILYVAGLVVSVSPWIVYSLVRFNKPWITDNSGTLFLVKSSIPTRVNLPGEEVETLFSAPAAWFQSLFTSKVLILFGLVICSFVGLVCILFCCYQIFVLVRNRKVSLSSSKMLLTVLLFYFLKTCMYVVVGYPEERYHIETAFIVTFALVAFCCNRKKDINVKPLMIANIPAAILTLVLFISSYGYLGFPMRTLYMADDIKDGNFGTVSTNLVMTSIDSPNDYLVELNDTLEGLVNDGEAVLAVSCGYDLEVWADYKIYANPEPNHHKYIEYVIQTHPDITYVVMSNTYEDAQPFAIKYPGKQVGDYLIFYVKGL